MGLKRPERRGGAGTAELVAVTLIRGRKFCSVATIGKSHNDSLLANSALTITGPAEVVGDLKAASDGLFVLIAIQPLGYAEASRGTLSWKLTSICDTFSPSGNGCLFPKHSLS